MKIRPRYKVIGTYDFDSIRMSACTGDDFRFRVEILKECDSNKFTARIWRREYYSIRPSFPGVSKDANEIIISSEMVLVEDFVILPKQSLVANEEQIILDEISRLIEQKFFAKAKKKK